MEFIRELTEQSDARHKAMKLFNKMNKIYDTLENIHDELDSGPAGKAMKAQGYGEGELKDILHNLEKAIDNFGDFMPGLEMEMRGE